MIPHQLTGIAIGLCTFLIIGAFHPIVIKAHYYFGVGCRWVFGLAALLFATGSLLSDSLFLSIMLGVLAFSSLWSILEIGEQEKRVARGWFPANPKRRKKAQN